MEKSLLAQLKERLEEERKKLVQELSEFAKPNKAEKDEWTAEFPAPAREHADMEEEADEMEEFENRLALERTLEGKLKDVDLALEKMGKGNYGICENCGKEISLDRLKAYPEAKRCLTCQAT